MRENKLDEKKCKFCYGKRFYSVILGLYGAEDFGGDGFYDHPRIINVACTKCNRGNRRKIKGVVPNPWSAFRAN